MVSGLNRLLGRDTLLVRGGGSADADQAGDLGDLEPRVTVEQEMAEHAIGEVIVAAALAEAQGRLQQAALLGRQSLFGNLRLGKPLSVIVGKRRPWQS